MPRSVLFRAVPFTIMFSLLGLTVAPAKSRAQAVSTSDAFEGSFRHAGGKSDRQALDDAIDEATADMNMFTRGFARKRLRARLQIPAWQGFHFEGGMLVISSPTGSVEAPVDGRATPGKNSEGEAIEVSHRISGRLVQQVVKTEEGRRETRFSLDAENQRLQVEVTITADALPEPIRYRLTYRR